MPVVYNYRAGMSDIRHSLNKGELLLGSHIKKSIENIILLSDAPSDILNIYDNENIRPILHHFALFIAIAVDGANQN
jgi:hypothetical protein